MTENEIQDFDWSLTSFEGSRREQLRRWSRLPLENILGAVEEMGDLSRQFQATTTQGRLQEPVKHTGRSEAPQNRIQESGVSYKSTSAQHEIILHGCTPEPLMSYLKALGVLRLVSEDTEHGDPGARGFWREGTFILRSAFDKDKLRQFFLNDYKPTPIIAPWGARSGFYSGSPEKKAREALEFIMEQNMTRLSPFQDAVCLVRNLLLDLGLNEKPKDEEKLALLHGCRQRLPNRLLNWLDTCFVLTDDGRKFPPLLGTGGNEGSGSYVSGFAQQVVTCIIERSHDTALHVALFGGSKSNVHIDQTSGHFSPSAAGGPNSGQGMTGQIATNAWDYLLCLEGACVWASSAVRRLGQTGRNMAAFPFTVNVSGAGSGTTTLQDAVKPKKAKREIAEMWLPLWSKPITINEVSGLFAEGRATVGTRAAQNGVDLVRAIAGLGVDRGITEFQRNAFLMRNGQSFLCVGIDRVAVQHHPSVSLIKEIDPWLDRFRSGCKVGQKGEAPTRLTSKLRGIDSAIFDYCRYGGRHQFQAILIALGRAERELMRDGHWAIKNRVGPLHGLSADWIEASRDSSPEFELALALAGIHSSGDVGPLRVNLEPVRAGRRKDGGPYANWADKDRAVVWNQSALAGNLSVVLARRMQDATRQNNSGLPLWSPYAASLDAIAAYLAGQTDNARLEKLLWGLLLIDSEKDQARTKTASVNMQEVPPLSRLYALMKPLFLHAPIVYCTNGWRFARKDEGITIRPEPRILPLLRAGHINQAVHIATQRLRVSGLQPMVMRGEGSWPVGQGPRLASALLFPIGAYSLDRLLRLVVRRGSTAIQPEGEVV